MFKKIVQANKSHFTNPKVITQTQSFRAFSTNPQTTSSKPKTNQFHNIVNSGLLCNNTKTSINIRLPHRNFCSSENSPKLNPELDTECSNRKTKAGDKIVDLIDYEHMEELITKSSDIFILFAYSSSCQNSAELMP